MGKTKKTNPRNIPRTQADCDRSWKEGCIEGMRVAEAIFMTVIKDKHAHEIDLLTVWNEIVDKTEGFNKGYFTAADLRNSLREEYGIDLLTGPSKAIAHDRRNK